MRVSTHSRLKAAGLPLLTSAFCRGCFNTQPPEGGWLRLYNYELEFVGFNTQPPEGGWPSLSAGIIPELKFQHTAA